MNDTSDVKHFAYRTPRHPFCRKLDAEIPQDKHCRSLKLRGIDISVEGVAVEVEEQLDPAKPVIVTVPLRDRSTARITARVLCQSENHCRLGFEFSSAEQCAEIQELIARLSKFR